MPDFTAPWDLQRPTPQPSTSVASAPPAQISDAGPQVTAAAGKMWGDLAQETDKYSEHLDTLTAQDAVNKLRAKKDDLTYGEAGFMRIKGLDVIDQNRPGGPLMTDYTARFQAASDDLAKNLSPRARQLYNQKFAAETSAYKVEIAKHSIQETEVANKSVYNGGTQQDIADATRFSGDPLKLTEIADRTAARTMAYAKSQGLDAPALAVAARSNVIRAGIEDRIAKNDGAGALALYQLKEGDLDGKDRIDVQRQIKTVEMGQIARSYVGDLNVDEGARRDLVIKSFTDKGYSREDGAAFAANFFHESKFRTSSAVNKADGRDGSDSINMGQWNGSRAVAFKSFAVAKGLDENDPQTAIKYAQAELDGSIPQSISGVDPALKDRLKNAKTAAEKAAILSQGFFKPKAQTEHADRGATAERFLKDTKVDPLATAVNDGVPVPGQTKAEGMAGFLDTRRMMIAADEWHMEALKRNQTDWARKPDQLAMNKGRIDVQYEQRKADVTLAKERLYANVEDWVTKPGANGTPQTERPPPEIWNQLTYEKQRSIDSTLAHNAKGKDRITDMPTFYALERMAGAQPAEFANVDLMQHFDKLSKADFEKLSGLQRTALGSEPTLGDLRDKHAIIKDGARAAGLLMTESKMDDVAHKKLNDFYGWIEDSAASWTKQNGRKPNGKEWQAIVDGVTMKIPQTGGTFGSDKSIYDMTAADVPEPVKQKFFTTFIDRKAPEPSDHDLIAMHAATKQGAVPAASVPIMASELKKRGRAVTPQNILGAWRLLQSQIPDMQAP